MCTHTKLTFLTASVLALGVAQAQDTRADIDNSQTNMAEVISVLNGNVQNVTDDVSATAAAIGNSYTAEISGNGEITNSQIVTRNGDVQADLDLSISDQVGFENTISLTAAAIGNSASVTIDDVNGGDRPVSNIANRQTNYSAGAVANLSTTISNVDGETELTAAAINNSFSSDVLGTASVDNSQYSRNGASASTNVDVDNALSSVTSTTAAIANSASFTFDNGDQFQDMNNTQTALGGATEAVAGLEVTNQQGEFSATVAAIGNSASFEYDGDGNGSLQQTFIDNYQVNASAGTFSDLTGSFDGLDKGAELTSAAIGNSVSVDISGSADFNNEQHIFNDVVANTNISVGDSQDRVSTTTAAIGNSASVTYNPENFQDTELTNFQGTHRGAVNANLDATGQFLNAGFDSAVAFEATAAAIANSYSVEGAGNLNATNVQTFRDDARATSNIDLSEVTGDVLVTTAAIGNSASFDIEQADSVRINNTQSTSIDPTAISNVDLARVEGNVEVTSAAIANTLTVSTLPTINPLMVNSVQTNDAYTEASVSVNVTDLVGGATFTAAAIGNSVSISNLPN